MEKKTMVLPPLQYWLTLNVGLIVLGATVTAFIAAYTAATQAEDAALSKAAAAKATQQLVDVNAGVRRVEQSLGLPAGSTVDQIMAEILKNQAEARLREVDRDQREVGREQTAEERRLAAEQAAAIEKERQRRVQVVNLLIREWINEHIDGGLPGDILSGTKLPPLDWMNPRLHSRDEQFQLLSTDPLKAMPPVTAPLARR